MRPLKNKDKGKKDPSDNKHKIEVEHSINFPGLETVVGTPVETEFVKWDEKAHPQRIDKFYHEEQDQITFGIIVGDKGSGKTAYVFYILEMYEGPRKKDIYIYKPPNPEVIHFINEKFKTNLKILANIQDLLRISNAIVYIDEPQLTVAGGDIKTFINLVTISRHRDITIWASSVNTRYFTLELEALADCFIIRDCDPRLIKRGSLAQSVIKEHFAVDWKAFRLPKDEYLFYSRRFDTYNGKWRNPLPRIWCEELSKPYMLEHRAQVIAPNVKGFRNPDYVSK